MREFNKETEIINEKEIDSSELKNLGIPNDFKNDSALLKTLNSLDRDKIREEIVAICTQVQEQFSEDNSHDTDQIKRIIFERMEKNY